MAARLNHRNVVRICNIVEEDDHPWIVMEFLPYRSLRDIVRDEGPLHLPGRQGRPGDPRRRCAPPTPRASRTGT